MTDSEINIAIAETIGYKKARKKNHAGSYNWLIPNGREEYSSSWVSNPPNYTSDLNACHEFEKTLSLRDRRAYTSWLYESSLNLGTATWESAHATARQRCEAYLKTIGKWIE